MMKTLLRVMFISMLVFLLAACQQVGVLALNQLDLTKVAIEHDELYLMGEFNTQSYQQVKSIIESNPSIKTIVLTVNPGSLDDETTFKLARYIRNKKLNTHLLSQSVIASGAVDLFLAGVNRTMARGARLGVHSWTDGDQQAKDFPRDHPAHDFNAMYIRDMMGDDDFYWYTIYAASADEIFWMSNEDIERFNLVTHSILAPENKQVPFGNEFVANRRAILEQ